MVGANGKNEAWTISPEAALKMVQLLGRWLEIPVGMVFVTEQEAR